MQRGTVLPYRKIPINKCRKKCEKYKITIKQTSLICLPKNAEMSEQKF